ALAADRQAVRGKQDNSPRPPEMDDRRLLRPVGKLKHTVGVLNERGLSNAPADAHSFPTGYLHLNGYVVATGLRVFGLQRLREFQSIHQEIDFGDDDRERLVQPRAIANIADSERVLAFIGRVTLLGRDFFARFGQVAVTVAIDVETVAVLDQPDASLRLRAKDE